MNLNDPDFAAFVARLPLLRRYEDVVRERLYPVAMRRPGTQGSTRAWLESCFHENARNICPINRAFLKRTVVFADLVMDGASSENAVTIACLAHPDPHAGAQ